MWDHPVVSRKQKQQRAMRRRIHSHVVTDDWGCHTTSPLSPPPESWRQLNSLSARGGQLPWWGKVWYSITQTRRLNAGRPSPRSRSFVHQEKYIHCAHYKTSPAPTQSRTPSSKSSPNPDPVPDPAATDLLFSRSFRFCVQVHPRQTFDGQSPPSLPLATGSRSHSGASRHRVRGPGRHVAGDPGGAVPPPRDPQRHTPPLCLPTFSVTQPQRTADGRHESRGREENP